MSGTEASAPLRALAATDLVVRFPKQAGPVGAKGGGNALNGISIEIRPGEAFGIVGESGSGKTTLLRSLIGLYSPASGQVTYGGRAIHALPRADKREFLRNVHLLSQNPSQAFHRSMIVGDALAEPLRVHKIGNKLQRAAAIDTALEQVGLDRSFAERRPGELSGGQQQRLVLARALAIGAKMLLADEPMSALDVSIQAQVANLMKDLREQLALTYVIVAHDLTMVRYLCDRVAVMLDGRLVESGECEAVYGDPQHPYTRALLAAAPTIARGLRRDRLVGTWSRAETY